MYFQNSFANRSKNGRVISQAIYNIRIHAVSDIRYTIHIRPEFVYADTTRTVAHVVNSKKKTK